MTCPAEDWPEALRQRPVCPKKELPIPFVNEIGPGGVGMFRILDDRQAELCLRHRLCAMCSDPMGKEVALIGDVVSLEPDGYFIEPPVHERCGLIAIAGLCPFLSHERVPRRPPEDDTTVVGGGRHELADIGRTIAKRPFVMAITQSYSTAFTVNDTGGMTMVYQPRLIGRVRRYAWVNDRAAEVTEPPPRAVTVVRSQRRRKPPRNKR